MSILCALVIGHQKEAPGAKSQQGKTEFAFNDDLARRIEKKVKHVKIKRVYRKKYKTLPGDINALNPDFIVSLHCNAFNTTASGTEVIYYHESQKGKQMAEILQDYLVSYLGLPDRGIKSSFDRSRGEYLLKHTKAPAVIVEPFFIDNDHDLYRALENIDGLAQAYVNAIDEIAILFPKNEEVPIDCLNPI